MGEERIEERVIIAWTNQAWRDFSNSSSIPLSQTLSRQGRGFNLYANLLRQYS